LADEPTGTLDQENREQVHRLLLKLTQELKRPLVGVTHNPSLAKQMSRRITLREGKLEELV
ncbi:MAG: hypothetical protein H8E81_05170, partial [Deltaproteobacteria bacterium]|nr:hypothetical protein [Deltaproteobacteria bacterium]